jgi:hypothetical protein
MKLHTKQKKPTMLTRNHETTRGPSVNYSYHARRSDQPANTGRILPSDAAASIKQVGRFWVRQFGLAIFLLVASVGLVVMVSVSTTPKIVIEQSSGAQYLQPSAIYQNAASNILASSLLDRNKVTINVAQIRTKLLNEYPELADVQVVLPLISHTPVIQLTPSKPSLVLAAANGSYIVSDSGRALAAGTSIAGQSPKLPAVTDQSQFAVTVGQETLSSSDVQFVTTVAEQLAARKFNISSLTLLSKARELDVGIQGQPYFVKFNLQRTDPARQSGSFMAVQANLTKQNIVPSSYVDVRVEGRAYYK